MVPPKYGWISKYQLSEIGVTTNQLAPPRFTASLLLEASAIPNTPNLSCGFEGLDTHNGGAP